MSSTQPRSVRSRLQSTYDFRNSVASLPVVSSIRRSMVGVKVEPNFTVQYMSTTDVRYMATYTTPFIHRLARQGMNDRMMQSK